MKRSRWGLLVFPALWTMLLCAVFAGILFRDDGLSGSAETFSNSWARVGRLAWNTMATSLSAALISCLYGFLTAFGLVFFCGPRMRTLALSVHGAMLLIPTTAVAVAAVWLLGARGVATDLWFRTFPGPEGGLRFAPIFTLSGITFCFVWSFAPIVTLISAAILSRMDREVLQSALLESGWRSLLRRIILPLVTVAILPGVLLVFLLSFTDFSIPESLRNQPVLVTDVYTQFGVFYDASAALRSALFMAACALLGIGFLFFTFRNFLSGWELESPDEMTTALPKPKAYRLLATLAFFAAIIPTVLLAGMLVMTTLRGGDLLGVSQIVWDTTRQELKFSLYLAVLGASGAVALGMMMAACLVSWRHLRWPMAILGSVAFLLPGPIYGVAIKRLTNLPPGTLPFQLDDHLAALDSTNWPMLVAYWLRFSPIAMAIIFLAMKRIPSSLWESHALESRSVLRAVMGWVPAMILPSIVAAFVISLALVFGDSGAAILLVPPGTTTVSVRLLTLMHNAPTDQVSALCLVLMLPAMAGVPLWLWVMGGNKERVLR